MNDTQFTAISKLLRLRGSASQEAARLHLVEDVPVTESARRVGVTYQAASQAIKSVQAGMDLARVAVGLTSSPG